MNQSQRPLLDSEMEVDVAHRFAATPMQQVHWQRPVRASQRRSISAPMGLACVLSIASGLLSPVCANAETNTVKLRVAARVASFFRVKIEHQADSVTITENDIRRGFIDFSAATQFSVATNVATGFAVDFQPQGEIFVLVKVTGLQTPTEFGASGGSALQNGPRDRVSLHRLDYRFYVRPDALPGVYAWPMRIYPTERESGR